MSARSGWVRLAITSLLLSSAFVACGGLNAVDVVIVDDGGAPIGASGGAAAAGSSNSPMAGGDDGAVGGEGGAGIIVISDDPPSVVSVSPEDAATAVDPTSTIEIEFSESLAPATVDGAIEIKDGTRVVSGSLDYSGTTATFTADSRLDLLATYTISVTTDITDLAGTPLEAPFTASFTVRDGTWGHFTEISNPTGNVASSRYPSPVFDAQGDALVVWAQEPENGPTAIWGRFYDPADGWSESFPVSDGATACALPAVGMNAAGDAVVAWVQDGAPNDRVYARRFVAGAWEAKSLRVDIDNTVPSVPRIAAAMSPGGTAHVVWQYVSTYHYIAGNHASGLTAWKPNDTYISGSFDAVSGPAITFGADDNGFGVWAIKTGATVNVRAMRYLPASDWGSGTTIAGSTDASISNYATPDIVMDSSGGAMAAWKTTANDIATSRFTKATSWSAIKPADNGTGSVIDWTPRLANDGDDFWIMWLQNAGNLGNAYSNHYTGGAWGAAPSLLSNGDTSVHSWSETGFGLDRHRNGLTVWVQENDIRFARLIGDSQTWQPDGLVQTFEDAGLSNAPIESVTAVSANGMGASLYCTGYPYYENHQALFAAIFE